MYQKQVNYLKYIFILFITITTVLLYITTCISLPDNNNPQTGNEITSTGTGQTVNRTGSTRDTLFTGNSGRGLAIAVPAPSMSGGNQANSWIPQLFQDLITGDLARYSAMTVLDRRNESLVLAEQQLSASGNYSDDDYIAMGRLTNAKYIVAGNILVISDRYSVTFRINNTETNEIQASFNKQYVLQDIESGLAAKEAVKELLSGMGVELTANGERQLMTIQERPVRAQVRLAQGMAAERNNNEVESLVYFYQALNADSGMREATQHIQNFAQGSPGASIRERANWAIAQKEKWERIFNDLTDYVDRNLLIVVYDFSTITDEFDARTNKVTLTVRPGLKIIPNSEVLTVWKTVVDEWHRIRRLEENRSWANSLTVKRTKLRVDIREQLGPPNTTFYGTVDLFDSEGINIARVYSPGGVGLSIIFSVFPGSHPGNPYSQVRQILPQNRYFNNTPFKEVIFRNINISDITDDLSVKVISIVGDRGGAVDPAYFMSVSEWEEWLRR
jgi:TolB-like protein